MNKLTKAQIDDYIERVKNGSLHGQTGTQVRVDSRGVLAFRNGETFEEAARLIDRSGSHGLIVTPPELGVLKITRYLISSLQDHGVPFVLCRPEVLDAGGITPGTIRPIAVTSHRKLFTPADSVFQAVIDTTPRDRWGQRRSSIPTTRTTFFLSGYDRNELFPAAFLCELPRSSGRATSSRFLSRRLRQTLTAGSGTSRRASRRTSTSSARTMSAARWSPRVA
jgi:hypothetical protein